MSALFNGASIGKMEEGKAKSMLHVSTNVDFYGIQAGGMENDKM